MLPASPTAALNILVVDPCTDTTCSWVLLLRAWGHRPRAANNSAAALAAAEAAPPDLVLIEPCHLGPDGYELARRLKQSGQDGLPVVVAVTGRSDDGARLKASAAGCDLYLMKPVEPRQLRLLMDLCARRSDDDS